MEFFTDDGGLAKLVEDLQFGSASSLFYGLPVRLYFINFKDGVGRWRVWLSKSQHKYLLSLMPQQSVIEKYGRDI